MAEGAASVNAQQFDVCSATKIGFGSTKRHGLRRVRKAGLLDFNAADAHKRKQVTDLGRTKMKAFVVAVLFAVLSATGVAMLLNSMQEPGYVAFTTGGARVGDPGKNLIGPG